jgi:hypothetical protein
MFNGYCLVLSTENLMDIAQYYRLFNRHCSIHSSELSTDIARHCPRASELIMLNIIRKIMNVLETVRQNQISFDSCHTLGGPSKAQYYY